MPPRRGFECAGSPAYKRFVAGKALEWAEFTSGHSDEIGAPPAQPVGRYAAVLRDQIIELRGGK